MCFKRPENSRLSWSALSPFACRHETREDGARKYSVRGFNEGKRKKEEKERDKERRKRAEEKRKKRGETEKWSGRTARRRPRLVIYIESYLHLNYKRKLVIVPRRLTHFSDASLVVRAI
ncbi:hypothetical protein PUN28_006190 [Cardiocondyla obscurior]|uniref:Uncharacterized protein n=1 Tax=Cardiocondyla obscurior TaxID=286306 RepID=A0AAW2GCD5_9HYME